ncbi:Choline/Carnitine o-acyltransferase-domain-containing protein [Stachybotrys elegans]|uniref:Choline/Carnitine o-acyltransferase-domain-containing protein n=1 Tax=Stachybotrys elegans TaxID=80388 RepID=A0A8K0WSK0_9HYPO|nr:Choline/Carnitine o-acyltransferase-domain-containing protein [Stachybotrys elegans]
MSTTAIVPAKMEPITRYVAELGIPHDQKNTLLSLITTLVLATQETSSESTILSQSAHDNASIPEQGYKKQVAFVPNKLPRFPLPDINALCTAFLTGVKAFATPEELEATMRAVEEFKRPGSPGRLLYDRAAARANDPSIGNWALEPQLRRGFLDRRVSLTPCSSFWLGHPFSKRQHSQPERAAILAYTANQLRWRIEAGLVDPVVLNEQELTNAYYPWIFNAVRIPGAETDQMQQHPGNDYFVAFWRGHAFKISLVLDHRPVTCRELYNALELVLNHEMAEQRSFVTIFTADHRQPWSEARARLQQLSPDNASSIATIEAAAFTVSLDEASPSTQSERGRQFHFGGDSDAANRWHDKSLQFIVCRNGYSATLGEHTMMDAMTLNKLNEDIAAAIEKGFEAGPTSQDASTAAALVPIYLPLQPDAKLEAHIDIVRPQYARFVQDAEHVHHLFEGYGSTFLRAHRMSPNSVFQMIVQLAAKSLYGESPPCFETVNQAHYDMGRVDIIQVVNPQVAAFLQAAHDPSVGRWECRNLLINATRAHVASINKARRNLGWERTLTALHALLEKDDDVPSLFRDPVYRRVRPRLMISNCFDSGMLEKGCLWRDREALWLHYEVHDECAFFSVATREDGRATQFCKHFMEAAELVRAIVLAEQ